ncbi:MULTISPECIES: carbamate kinase [unclassified Fusibacter]|uniref:carbamate kinase n=1 Tax=unclassified Fusibacter TaxID=2624464 RepID=UPI0010137814|nr:MULTISPECIES: carbamate kinase [unclassified Fusibacter]MCK8059297.1 carbamate kinase [Fusibacter sp. A2]NPE21239.1 carbamate kinase [Fusibacter sp. A1]RXV62610.1 carbamate kinase [Fusibacter sp. A1]
MKDKIVVALGGNALGNTPEEQLSLVLNTAKPIVDLIEHGHEVILAHGNGPQVGMINLAMSTSANSEAKTPEMPFPECGAMSQGYIGYHLQNAIREELLNRGLNVPVATVITQVIVDKDDQAFQNPTKPIGAFYSEEEAKMLIETKGYQMKEDSGRGWRRVVASPKPVDVAEKETVKALVDHGHVVISVGGGGIPVIAEGNKLIGVPAVIDKDFASAKLAEILDADYLIILTAVDQVAINFGKENEKWLSSLSLEEANQYIEEGHFAPGSMLPKVQAAMAFAASKPGRKALITSLERAEEGIEGKTGTVIVQS